MAATFRSISELIDIYNTEVQVQNADLTDFSEGSINDVLSGSGSTIVHELMNVLLKEFQKSFFLTANGPEVTGDEDDLQTLAVDRFGEDFERPGAAYALVDVTLSRPTSAAGDCPIAVDTVVKTLPDSNGVEQRFKIVSAVTMTALSISATAQAVEPGVDGNVDATKISVIETTLLDPSITVSNPADAVGGAPEEDDSEYRETIKNLIKTLGGASASAIEAKALTVAGVEKSTAVEFLQFVKEWDISTGSVVGEYFGIPRARLYISDINGEASQALIDAVKAAILNVRACGVRVEVIGSEALSLNWSASLVLDPSGPNFTEFTDDAQKIIDTMQLYMQDLDSGETFDRSAADAAMLALWGPAGTGDLTAEGFSTVSPVGDVEPDENEKIVPGTVVIV